MPPPAPPRVETACPQRRACVLFGPNGESGLGVGWGVVGGVRGWQVTVSIHLSCGSGKQTVILQLLPEGLPNRARQGLI